MSTQTTLTRPEQSVAPFMPTPALAPPAPPKISVQEYLALERQSEIRHEYVDGEMIAMAGESFKHNKVAGNFYIGFEFALRDRDCEVYMEGVRVRVSPTRSRYPDVVVVCGEHQDDGENPPALLNPNAIVEILSPSTQSKDRGEKLSEYWRMTSLTDYALAAQDKISVTHYRRQNEKDWTATEYNELTDTLTFAALDVTISLADIYRGVTFPPPPESESN